MAQTKFKKNKAGFTLIELLIVISIIGTLTALLLANFVGVRGRAKDARSKAGLRELKTALRLYYNDNQNYPATGGVPSSGAFTSADGNTVYMKDVPEDFIYYSDASDDFILQTTLENASDEDIANTQTQCDPGSQTFFSGSVGSTDYFVCD